MNRIRAICLMMLGTTAWAAPEGQSPTPPAASAPCPRCNVVLVSFDALQPAHAHAYGYARRTTPTIDQLASQGVLFSHAYSPAPWTLPAHMSWFTGTYPSLHKVINKYVIVKDKLVLSNLQDLAPGTVTLPEVLRMHGYATGGFTGGAGVGGAFGFKQGFDEYFDNVPPFSGMETSAPKALDWLAGLDRKKPFFLFLHGYGAHGQYMPPGGYDKRFVNPPYEGPYDGTPSQQRVLRELGLRGPIELDPEDVQFWRDLYDEKITRADTQFAGFLSGLRELGLDKNTIFIVASDHGTEEYEHQKFDHGYSLYDELEHVLFLIVVPGGKGGRVVHAQVGTIDIMPTILGLVGISPNAKTQSQLQGKNLLPLMTGREAEGEDVYMETDYRLFTHKRGIRTRDGWKLIDTLDTGQIELYNLNDDPGETANLAEEQPAKTHELKDRLLAHYKAIGVDLAHWDQGCSPVYPDQCH